MRAIDEPFEQAVGGQPVRAVQAAGADFARGPQAGNRRLPGLIDRHAADHVVRAGPHGNLVARDVDAELLARRGDAGESLQHECPVEVRHVEIDAGVPRLFHLADDRLRDDVARRELGPRVVVGMNRTPSLSTSQPPSPRIASVIRLRLPPAM